MATALPLGARALLRASWALLALTLAACSRSGLDIDLTVASSTPDAGVTPVVPATLPACAGTGTPGSVVWTYTLPSDLPYTGPWAADSDGTTFFLGADTQYPKTYTLLALDSCGKVLWQVPDLPTKYGVSASQSVLVSGDQVVVQWGQIDGFDRKTGAHRWTFDYEAYAKTLGIAPFSGQGCGEVAPLVASADGTMFLAFIPCAEGQLVSLTPGGKPANVATFDVAGDLISLLLDGAGHLDLLLNTALEGALVHSFTRSGAPVFTQSFACQAGILGELASGSRSIFMETGPCELTFEGGNVSWPGATQESPDYGGMVVDARDFRYVATNPGLASFDRSGKQRWSVVGQDSIAALQLLEGGEVLVETFPSSRKLKAGAYSVDNGNTLWSLDLDVGGWDTALYFQVLVTAAEQLVFVSGGEAQAVATAARPASDAPWSSSLAGAPDGRRAMRGQ